MSGWGTSSACSPHPQSPQVSIAQSLPRECNRGSCHWAPSSGWAPLLSRAIRITLSKILIIVASKGQHRRVPSPAQEVQIISTTGLLVTPCGELCHHVIPSCPSGMSHILEPSLRPTSARGCWVGRKGEGEENSNSKKKKNLLREFTYGSLYLPQEVEG